MRTNTIYCGDNLNIMANVIDFPDSSIDLIYLDPPFFTNRQYEVIWGDSYEIRSFEDRWAGGIENYIAWMEPRMREMHRLLKDTGSMYLHCDYRASAHLRLLADRVFEHGPLNEIIWHYRTGGVSKRWWAQKTDTILFYTKGSKWKFHPMEIREYYKDLYGPSFKPSWNDRNGGKDENGYYHIIYQDNVWDIPGVFNMSKEYQGYPTQKPEKLLERIVNASSDVDDVVLDPFCGCGTAIAVAQKLGRKWIGIDVSPTACNLMQKRMSKLGLSEVPIIGLPMTIDELRKLQHFDFQNWAVQKLMGRSSKTKTGDMGIDGYLFDGTPIQVKQSDNIGRNIIDNFETAMRRINKTKGIVVAFSFGRGAHEEAARAKNQDGLEIELRTVQQILDMGV